MESSKQKHILFLLSSLEGGGAERVATQLCNHWAEKGYEVTLMSTYSGRGGCQYALNKKIQLEYLADRVATRKRTNYSYITRIFALRNAIQEINPDVVIAFMTPVNVAALIASFRLGIRVIVSERSYPPDAIIHVAWRILRRITYPFAYMVVSQTNVVLSWLKKHCGNVNVEVIPNPLKFPMDEPDSRLNPESIVNTSRKLILGVGRLVELKGFEVLIRAFAIVSVEHSDWDLVLLGEGEQRDDLEDLVTRLGLQGRVYLPGQMENITSWYQCSNLYVLSSRFEGFPNALLEAMAHGLPVVSFNCKTGPAEIITDGKDGLLVEWGTGAQGLANAMSHLMENMVLRQQLGDEAKKVRQRFSIESISQRWEALFE